MLFASIYSKVRSVKYQYSALSETYIYWISPSQTGVEWSKVSILMKTGRWKRELQTAYMCYTNCLVLVMRKLLTLHLLSSITHIMSNESGLDLSMTFYMVYSDTDKACTFSMIWILLTCHDIRQQVLSHCGDFYSWLIYWR